MFRLFCAGAALVGVVIGIAFAYHSRPASLSEEDWDVCEAVLRFQMSEFPCEGMFLVVYVQVQGANPSAAFLGRFQGYERTVRPGWQFRRGSGILCHISQITRTGEDSAEVIGGLRARGDRYFVVRKEGKWVVTREPRSGTGNLF
jgi:hypothetical protein